MTSFHVFTSVASISSSDQLVIPALMWWTVGSIDWWFGSYLGSEMDVVKNWENTISSFTSLRTNRKCFQWHFAFVWLVSKIFGGCRERKIKTKRLSPSRVVWFRAGGDDLGSRWNRDLGRNLCKFTGCLCKEKAAQECHTEELKVCKSLMWKFWVERTNAGFRPGVEAQICVLWNKTWDELSALSGCPQGSTVLFTNVVFSLKQIPVLWILFDLLLI